MLEAKPSLVYVAFSLIALLLAPAANYVYSQAAPSSGISILSSSFTDDIGDYHVVGEVKNNSPGQVLCYNA
jgi:hypothetical protein